MHSYIFLQVFVKNPLNIKVLRNMHVLSSFDNV